MPSSVNVVVLVGNLTRDPELRTIPSGTSVCELGLAVNERYKDGASGDWLERANFFDVTVWGAQGENCARYLEKGRQVAVHGRLRWESWEKDGQKRSKVKVVADTVQFLNDGKGGREREDSGYRLDVDVPIDAPEPAQASRAADDSDDIPFRWEGERCWSDRYHANR